MNAAAFTLHAFHVLFPDEDTARAWFERARWPDGPVCPACGCVDHACWLKTVRRWECTACHRQFTVTAGTPMHRPNLLLLTWAQTLVLVAAERDGDVVARAIPTHGRAVVAEALDGLLDADAVAMTDGLPAYLGTERTHLSVIHSQREYARTDAATGHRVHVVRVESFNSFLGRAVVGVFHFASPKHLGRYAGEAAFRWNRKADACLERIALLVRNSVGRTLPYGFLTGVA